MAQGQAGGGELQAAIENITSLAREAGMFGEMDEAQLTKQIEELAQLMVDGNDEAVQKNKLFQAIFTMLQEAEAMAEGQQPTGGQVPQQGAAPKDFASMMPPTPGGGMSGR